MKTDPVNLTMQNKKLVCFIVGFIVMLFGVCFVLRTPSRIFTSTFWSPQPYTSQKDNVVVVEMGSNNSWPLLAKSVGSFVEEHAVVNVIVISFRDVSLPDINALQPKAVILGGYFQSHNSYKEDDLAGLFDFLRNTELPVLGICGGLQFIGKAFGSNIVPIGKVEKGIIDVSIIKDDPILAGLSKWIEVYTWHSKQVDPLPEKFVVLGINNTCRIQIMKHETKKIYGVQFHPEYSSARCVDGITIVKNFYNIAGIPCTRK